MQLLSIGTNNFALKCGERTSADLDWRSGYLTLGHWMVGQVQKPMEGKGTKRNEERKGKAKKMRGEEREIETSPEKGLWALFT